MASTPLTRAQVIDKINSVIGPTLTTTWTDAKINDLIDQSLSEISDAVPFVMVDTYQIESRDGIATSTSSNNLVDATNAQFSSADTGKIVYNTTDKTWAVIISYSSTSQVGLSKDIFTVGEGYEIYNKGCWNKKQINISDSGDFLSIIGVVYPVTPDEMFAGSMENLHNVRILDQNKIIELDTWYVDNSKDSDSDKDVQVYFARQHQLNSMTDLAGAVNGSHTAGSTSIAMASLGSTETIYKNTLFTVALASGISSRLTYRVTADVTTSGNAATVSCFPATESTISTASVVTFIGSTLTPDLERILIDLVTGQILMAEGLDNTTKIAKGGQGASARQFEMGRAILEKARIQLKGMVDVDLRSNRVLPN